LLRIAASCEATCVICDDAKDAKQPTMRWLHVGWGTQLHDARWFPSCNEQLGSPSARNDASSNDVSRPNTASRHVDYFVTCRSTHPTS
jgi:hypothetical protein